jgi:hypothetical protein
MAAVVEGVIESTFGVPVPGDAPRLLIVSYYFPPHESVGGLRWAGIMKYLARMGWEVAVLTGGLAAEHRSDGNAEVTRCPRLWTLHDGFRTLSRLLPTRSRSRVGGSPAIEALPTRRWRLARELAALFTIPDESRGWMVRAAIRARSLIRRFRPDVVVSSGPPHVAHLVAGLASMGGQARWLIDFRDPWAGLLGKDWQYHPRLGTRLFHLVSTHLERLACQAADGIIANTPQLAAAVAARYPGLPIACIPNGVDAEELPAPARDPLPGLRLAYAGTLYGGRDMGPVVRALGAFVDRHPATPVMLTIAGEAEGRHARALEVVVAETGLQQHVEVRGRLPRQDALRLIAHSHVAVVLAQGQELQVPAKLYESVAMGIPTLVVADRESAAGREGSRIGATVCDPGDLESTVRELERVWCNHTIRGSRSRVPVSYEAVATDVDQLLRWGFAGSHAKGALPT